MVDVQNRSDESRKPHLWVEYYLDGTRFGVMYLHDRLPPNSRQEVPVLQRWARAEWPPGVPLGEQDREGGNLTCRLLTTEQIE